MCLDIKKFGDNFKETHRRIQRWGEYKNTRSQMGSSGFRQILADDRMEKYIVSLCYLVIIGRILQSVDQDKGQHLYHSTLNNPVQNPQDYL